MILDYVESEHFVTELQNLYCTFCINLFRFIYLFVINHKCVVCTVPCNFGNSTCGDKQNPSKYWFFTPNCVHYIDRLVQVTGNILFGWLSLINLDTWKFSSSVLGNNNINHQGPPSALTPALLLFLHENLGISAAK